jgi:molybdopterin converting factor small subunit
MQKTKVHFRKFKEGDVIAIFPDEQWDLHCNVASYMHIGQHGGASPELIDELEAVDKEEYEPLQKELESIGYDLKILK